VWIRIPLLLLLGLHAAWALSLAALRFINPITTGVQIQRRVEAWLTWSDYDKHSTFVPLERISPHLQHAVIAAEDGRFYQHHGIDWQQVELVMQESLEEGEIPRGASTITQQLVKNLYFTTHRNPFRKVFEYTLAPMASVILGKRRVLELYLNTVEWGPGVWGAQAAAEYHYRGSAGKLTREQSSRLAACLPLPRRRRPQAMNRYSAIIETRMGQLGW
jgi:monofunctional biosynthetic peptidoglycan transglycosylase